MKYSQYKNYLLKLAHQTLYNALHGVENHVEKLDIPNDKCAVFVTLYKNNQLRGCIGTLEPELPINEAIIKYTLLSAFNDHRFSKVEKSELNDLKIEISILTEPKRIHSYEEIVFGLDGVIIEDENHNRGVFLPDVAEHFDNLKDFMEELCEQKLGRNRNFYLNKDAKLFVFRTEKMKDGG